MTDFNDRIIAEFRANDGVVGGPFTGAQLLLLTTTGAKSGERRVAPVMYFAEGDTSYVIASKAGSPTNPAWFHNLVAHPTVSVEAATDDGIESYTATAEQVTGELRERLYTKFSSTNPGFAEYQRKTDRVIPIVALTRAG
ncbi:nitroreductase family deazaflavin-dependent oxidoreductase [Glaciihabitans sp. INWT7]|uniref:nitroreductase family deazaflavin-dependent oxidoreductase n=1 Tax=Glaciihabitans sp. INWT7 TaxID=2596912 RepID=UPI0016294B03|nr:nitroreductase family deazaflavin-dependent oxidoreductase [Glaciihabitans sp. INWT7]QNE47230.1 nitroreductase family deazaflavin-dependent oxidoreductase [Glaciihabitans sp. INWT7]